jgi:K+-transporting ATPase ATPase B chain
MKHEHSAIHINPLELAKKTLLKFGIREQARNPVMFLVYAGTIAVSLIEFFRLASGASVAPLNWHLLAWLWFTLVFANAAESIAEMQGKARADSLRGMREGVKARRLRVDGIEEEVDSGDLRRGDVVRCQAGDLIPVDGEIIEGIASVNEAAVTGESSPVIRESGGDRDSVIGGTLVISDGFTMRVSNDPGDGFIDRMAGLVEQASRKPTPGEVALSILLSCLSIIFVAVVATLPILSSFVAAQGGQKADVGPVYLVSLLACLLPTTISSLLSAIGISGVTRLMQKNVLALSGRAVEAAGDVDVLLVDKTGTITWGDRQATEIIPAPGVPLARLAQASARACQGDDTPEGRSVLTLLEGKELVSHNATAEARTRVIPFSAQTQMSGLEAVDEAGAATRSWRKGSAHAMENWAGARSAPFPKETKSACDRIARAGGTPLVVAEDGEILGAIHLKDIVKPGIRERFESLRAIGIKSVMITGDNPLTAAAIASEAGVDDFVAEALPEEKLTQIRAYQAEGHLVAMMGDGTNDAPALAQADVGIAMSSGTQTAKEAGNMVDFDNDPTKLIAVVETGKQLLMTRGALTTFSIANDVAKYFAILPALFSGLYAASGATGPLSALNLMGLSSPAGAMLSAVIFNALIIVALIPLALRGIHFSPRSAKSLLLRNLLVYGLGGLLAPFLGIKLIDIILHALGVA